MNVQICRGEILLESVLLPGGARDHLPVSRHPERLMAPPLGAQLLSHMQALSRSSKPRCLIKPRRCLRERRRLSTCAARHRAVNARCGSTTVDGSKRVRWILVCWHRILLRSANPYTNLHPAMSAPLMQGRCASLHRNGSSSASQSEGVSALSPPAQCGVLRH